ncbi:MAG: hypothetical protein Q8K97_17650 [Pseudohongiella sp.]|nr:hypothetical protein [Pseudohongiella sp.]
MMENFAREDMHPADTVEAFKKMVEQGKSEKNIAASLGLSAAHVKRVLKLANVSPVLLAAFRAKSLDMEQMQAFALSNSHEAQEACYESLKRQGTHALRPANVRKFLTGDVFTHQNRLAKAVGLAAYKKAGGTTTVDLFENITYLNDSALLLELARGLLSAQAEQLISEGWKWVEIRTSESYVPHNAYKGIVRAEIVGLPAEIIAEETKLEKELETLEEREYGDDWTEADDLLQEKLQTRMEEIEQIKESHQAFTSEQKASCGCEVLINEQGQIVIEYGRQKAEDIKAVAKVAHDDMATEEPEPAQEPEAAESAALRLSLGQYKLQAMQAELISHPSLAIDLMAFSMADRMFGSGYSWSAPVAVTLEQASFEAIEPDTHAGTTIEKAKASLDLSWLSHETSADRLTAFMALPAKAKQQIMVVCVAGGLRHKDENSAVILGAMKFDLFKYWQPTAENYFGRMKTASLLDIGQSVIGSDWYANAKNLKKKEVAQSIATDKAMTGWLPESMK